MRIPLSWLKEYVDIVLPIDELVQRLTLGGLEVEDVERIGVEGSELPWDDDKIFVANILEVKPHPNADRLVLADVDYGAEQPHTVVTGAPNIFEYRGKGRLTHPLKSIFAKEGSRLYDGHQEGKVISTLKARPVRGVMSDAMLCSEKELGMSDEHEGILLLPDDAPVGTPLRDYLGEVVFDIALTPNMSRCLSIIGTAREVAALTGAELHIPDPQVQASGPALDGQVKVTIETPQLCPRFTATIAENVQLGPSPQWMQRRLRYAGMRPINNVVDISNYVMLEWGCPNHIFDADKVTDGHLVIRSANPGEQLTTLDGKEYVLTSERLLVCDPERALSLAGVMGGLDSEVSDTTTRVLVEAAVWEPTGIRRTAQTLKMRSEASYRFERGVDIESPPVVQRRCLQLLQELAGATVYTGMVDVYPEPWQPLELKLSSREVRRLLGIRMSVERIAELLAPLGFNPEIVGGSADMAQGYQTEPAVRVRVPSWRGDVQYPADLVEDVARLHGYERIPPTMMADELPYPDAHPELVLEQQTRDLLAGIGLDEAITYPLTSMEAVARLQPSAADPSKYLRLANPATPEREYMRHSLLTTLLESLALNLRERDRTLLFEIGRAYLPVPGEVLPDEQPRLGIVMAGPREHLSWQSGSRQPLDFFDLKGVVDTLLVRLGISNEVTFVPLTDDERFHPGRAARLERIMRKKANDTNNAQSLGVLGELHPAVRERLELAAPRVAAAELDLNALFTLAKQPYYHPISRFPATLQDLAIIAEKDVPATRIAEVIKRAAGDVLETLTLFDVYEGPQLGASKRSLAYRLSFRVLDRTLSDEALVKVRTKIIKTLERELGATIRS